MKRFSVITCLLFFLTIRLSGQTDNEKISVGGIPVVFLDPVLAGKYQSQRKFDGIQLTLKKDSTYKQEWSSCTFYFKTAGRWKTKGGTVLLFSDKVKVKINQYECERVIKETNKLQINSKSDTLYILRDKGTTGIYKTYIPLLRVK